MKSYIKEDYEKVVQVSWRFSPQQVEFVKKQAKKENISESEVVRTIINLAMNKKQ